MTKTILDTSSLIALALAQRDTKTPQKDSRAFWQSHGGIDEAIEAFVLYDELVFDGPSLKRNIDRLPQLLELSRFGTPLWEEDTTLERRIYSSILRSYLPRIQASDDAAHNLFKMPTEEWMAADVGVRYYPSEHWRDVEAELTEEAAALARSLGERLGMGMSGAACALLLRTLYYDRLQQLAAANLIVHPLKGRFLGGLRDEGAQQLATSTILNLFDETVRRAFYERKEKWLGRHDLEYEVPMLTSFVLNKCKSWQELFQIVEELRESKRAHGFRQSINYLLNASKNRCNEEVEEILTQLSAAAEEWTKDLRQKSLKKKIRVSVPVISTELDIPDMKVNQTSGDRLLVFVHSLLAES